MGESPGIKSNDGLILSVLNRERVVSKGKGDIPMYTRYTRIGICKECGSDVYAPVTGASEDDIKLMSACACEGGPRVAAAGRYPETPLPGERSSEAGRKAA
jgi:hypothetical protein